MDVPAIPFNAFLQVRRSDPTGTALLELPDRPCYANHLGAVHASAQFALAEAASGECLVRRFAGLVDAETLIPVVRRSEVKFRRPAQGVVRAHAVLSDERVEQTVTALRDKGRAVVAVSVSVIDEGGETTMTGVYEWFVQRRDQRVTPSPDETILGR